MWALSIPSQRFPSTYPKETIRIDECLYEGFGSWIKGDNTPGWYLKLCSNVIKYDLFYKQNRMKN